MNAWRYCYEKELRYKPWLAGEVALGWTITQGGEVRRPVVIATDLHDAPVEGCLARVAERLRFAPTRSACSVEMKMTFAPLKP